ncbi:tRNA preQ1(34) S-adenosylmethionine ribosyltransferase-isomerase QueA [Syntrophorhabdus aromaticivorans]|uniref:S-adenosylmethionine:tRNA ribosyltransferase-isomerase n=1 Tax=Syntrophorhabdus aromaticivorans TaxID=328301 RepID=A0A351U7U0_9BACT|nr:tRNA preQ1(34) S-adenosylmethionine ribosyltransferase-isomerase QueA [Syntrophorhabdus aromaticivorans]NLW34812.1 tRNA preQ1(34) S-adenosylmethionine ribosyltransferase-isomerase QueA [Syntrophorhabdus aromaticivorans]HBA56021.1 S-adenosylmethionine:tRNA ribosyltransferase-isomerase [Syntrophorhabdus aromaticivorans]
MGPNIEDFDYDLPKALIAQYPEKDREASRLLVFDRGEETIAHRSFRDITQYLSKGDVLVLNDSKVLPARLRARKDTGGAVDILLVERISDTRWLCLAKGIKAGNKEQKVSVGPMEARLTKGEDYWVIDFHNDGDTFDVMRRYGTMPLPPYIKRNDGNGAIDDERYQTVYAEMSGSIAAPTAGFHFSVGLLETIKRMGVHVVTITLHIGVGTFFLIKKRNVQDHHMHGEYYHITPEAKAFIGKAKGDGRRIIACGTSAVRTLETVYSESGKPLAGKTDLFVYPGYRFKMVDAMITNFHLPRSTPLLLVSAFAGPERIRRCYKEAMERGYRFYSYGDAMLIL